MCGVPGETHSLVSVGRQTDLVVRGTGIHEPACPVTPVKRKRGVAGAGPPGLSPGAWLNLVEVWGHGLPQFLATSLARPEEKALCSASWHLSLWDPSGQEVLLPVTCRVWVNRPAFLLTVGTGTEWQRPKELGRGWAISMLLVWG